MMINFKGKIVLAGTANFDQNALYLESCLRKSGYKRKDRKDFDGGNWFTML